MDMNEYDKISFLMEEEELMCFVYSGFQNFASLNAKINPCGI